MHSLGPICTAYEMDGEAIAERGTAEGVEAAFIALVIEECRKCSEKFRVVNPSPVSNPTTPHSVSPRYCPIVE